MPGRVRVEDLPDAVRRKIAGRETGRLAPRPPRPAADTDDLPPRWTCHTCRAVFKAWPPAEAHANPPGHRRIEFGPLTYPPTKAGSR
jgi:hypothetical protein